MTNLISFPNSSSFFVEQQLTYQQWCEAVNFHRQKLLNNKANTWLLYCDDAFEFSVLFFALLSANKKIILPQNGTVNQLEQCLAYVDGFAGTAELAIENVLAFSAHASLPLAQPLTIKPNAELVLFTSGSSGAAKAIDKTFQHLLTEISQLEECFATLVNQACIVSTVSHQHIYGLLVKLIWPIWFGRDVILQPYEYPEHLCHDINKYGLKQVALVSSPAHFHRLVKDNVYQTMADKFSSLFSSGGPLSADASAQLEQDLGQSPIEIYGSTETGGIGWRQRRANQAQYWQPFNNVQVAQDSDSHCLLIKSPYFDCQGWYQTDDQIKLTDNGQFELCGRIDRIVKIEEKRVSLDHVQQCLKALDFIDDAYCLTQVKKRGLQIVATIVLTDSAKLELEKSRNLVFNRKIKAGLNKSMEAIAIPKRFRYLSTLPYNPSGKLNKSEMEKFFD